MITYIQKRDNIYLNKLHKNMLKLPEICYDFFIGIEQYTSPLTRYNYSNDLYIFFDYISKNLLFKDIKSINFDDLMKIKAIDIEYYLSYLSSYEINGKQHLNNEKGKARKLAAIKKFFKFNYNKDNLPNDVSSKVATPKLHIKPIVRLESDEVAKLITEAETPDHLSKRQQAYNQHTKNRDVAILSLFLGTGIRVSECVGINLSDLDLNNNAFKITRKGGNQVMLYFSDEVKNALVNYLPDREKMLGDTKQDALFVSLQKTRLTTRAIENIVKKYSKVVTPLKNISPHKLRSTYGTSLYNETGDIYVVAEVLGHKDVNTTKKHYAAISDEIRRQASTKVKLRDA